MSPRAKKEYLETIYLRYKQASRREKTLILDEFCATCGHHRKHAIRLLRNFKRFTKPKAKRRGRKPLYQQEELLLVLKRIWLTANLPCSKRLKVMIPLWLPGCGFNTAGAAGPPPNREPCCENRSPLKPTSGTSPVPAS